MCDLKQRLGLCSQCGKCGRHAKQVLEAATEQTREGENQALLVSAPA